MGLSSENTGAVRTGVNAGVIAAVVWVVDNYFTDYNVDTTDPLFIAGVVAVVGVGYRISRELVSRFPVLGRVLFGIDKPPEYAPWPPPPIPEQFKDEFA